MATAFKCPGCGEACATLRDLLTCCPNELRAYTDDLERNTTAITLTGLLTKGPTEAMRRRAGSVAGD